MLRLQDDGDNICWSLSNRFALFNMAAPARYCPSCLSAVGRTSTTSLLHRSAPAVTSSPFQQLRFAQSSQNALKYKRKDQPASQKKRKTRSTFAQPDLRDAIQFSLVDAMRYVLPYFDPSYTVHRLVYVVGLGIFEKKKKQLEGDLRQSTFKTKLTLSSLPTATSAQPK